MAAARLYLQGLARRTQAVNDVTTFQRHVDLHGTSNVASRCVGRRVIRCSSRHLYGLHVMAGLHEPRTRCGSLCFNASLVGSGNDSVISESFSVVRK